MPVLNNAGEIGWNITESCCSKILDGHESRVMPGPGLLRAELAGLYIGTKHSRVGTFEAPEENRP